MKFNSSAYKKADSILEQVINAIKNKDKKALMKLFSKKALSETDDIENRIYYLFEFVEGIVESWEIDKWSFAQSNNYGKKVTTLRAWYKVITDRENYLFFLMTYTIDAENFDNVGLYALCVIKEDDEATQFTNWQDMMIAGIYKPNNK